MEVDNQPKEIRDRWKIVEKMTMITQYAFAGDYTSECVTSVVENALAEKNEQIVEAIEKAVDEVSKFDAGERSGDTRDLETDSPHRRLVRDCNFGRQFWALPHHGGRLEEGAASKSESANCADLHWRGS